MGWTKWTGQLSELLLKVTFLCALFLIFVISYWAELLVTTWLCGVAEAGYFFHFQKKMLLFVPLGTTGDTWGGLPWLYRPFKPSYGLLLALPTSHVLPQTPKTFQVHLIIKRWIHFIPWQMSLCHQIKLYAPSFVLLQHPYGLHDI